jgi:hypothetical protein
MLLASLDQRLLHPLGIAKRLREQKPLRKLWTLCVADICHLHHDKILKRPLGIVQLRIVLLIYLFARSVST